MDEIKSVGYFKGTAWNTLHTCLFYSFLHCTMQANDIQAKMPAGLLMPQFTYTDPVALEPVSTPIDDTVSSTNTSKPFAFSALFSLRSVPRPRVLHVFRAYFKQRQC